MFGNCIIIDYLLSTLIVISNSLTIYFVYPLIPDFIQIYVKEADLYKKGLLIGLIFTSYELAKILGSYFWKKISYFLGTPMCVSISLFLITFFNITFAFITNFPFLLLIRFLTGLANNLSTFMQSYLLEVFPSDKHKIVIQLFTFFQNLAVAIAMLSGLIMSLRSTVLKDDDVKLTDDKLNRYFLIAFLVAITNFTAFILNMIKYKFKIIIPKRRKQFYEQCDLNLDLSQRRESIIQRQGSKDSNDSNSKQRYSNGGYRDYSIHVMDKSNIHNPNKSSPSERYNPFGTINSNKTIIDSKNLSKSVELQPKQINEITPAEEKEIPISNENIIAEINSLHNTIKKNEIDYETYEKTQINRTSSNPISPDDKIKAGFFQLNEEPHEISSSNNRDPSNLDLTKNTIGIKQTNRLTQVTDKSEIKDINEDYMKISNLRMKKINKNLGIKRQGSSEKQNDIVVSSASDNIIRSNSLNTEANLKSRIEFTTLFKISMIYTNLQICDIILYNIFFINLALKLTINKIENTSWNKSSIFLISLALALFHLIYTILVPAVNYQIVKIGMKSNSKAEKVFRIFILVSIGLFVSFFVLDYFLSKMELIYVIVLMCILVLRNLALTVVLICYNILVLKISQSQVKEKINLLQNYFSLTLRTISGLICCILYVYFNDNYFLIALSLGIIPIVLLLWNLKLIKNLMNLLS